MIWSGNNPDKVKEAGERFRATHSSFLSRAIKFGFRVPRIPAKRVDEGGYSGLMKMSEEEKRSTVWWLAAMNRMDQFNEKKPK